MTEAKEEMIHKKKHKKIKKSQTIIIKSASAVCLKMSITSFPDSIRDSAAVKSTAAC
jgi:hypothetical protein